jgi:hypothetical protein
VAPRFAPPRRRARRRGAADGAWRRGRGPGVDAFDRIERLPKANCFGGRDLPEARWVSQIKKGPLGKRSFRGTLRFGRPRILRALCTPRARAPCVSAPQPWSELSQTSYLIIHDARMVPTVCRYEGHIGVPCVEGRHGRYMIREDGTQGMRKLGAGREVSISWSRGTSGGSSRTKLRARGFVCSIGGSHS